MSRSPDVESQCGSSEQTTHNDDTVSNRLNEFVEKFVATFEEKISSFKDESNKQGVSKSGKIADNIGLVGQAVGAALTLPIPVPGSSRAGAAVGQKVSNLISKVIGGKRHKQKAKKITNIFRKLKKPNLRRLLVNAGVDIFQKYESQFNGVTDGDYYWHRGIHKLATDAVDRVMYDLNKTEIKDNEVVSIEWITRGVVLGESKRVVFPGGRVEKNGTKFSTTELYENVGIVTIKANGSADKYYAKTLSKKKKKKKSSVPRCGYRLRFSWEKLNDKYEVPERPKECYEYILKSEELKAMPKAILDKINKEDSDRSISHSEGKKERQEPIGNGKQTWFNMQDSTTFFKGREVILKLLHDKLQFQDRSAIMPQTVAITGLGGIGKSELAREYAKINVTNYDNNVVWFDSETHESLKQSFKELAKEKDIPTTETVDSTTQDRDIKIIIKDVYKYFNDIESLFVFDNVENFKDLKDFLTSYHHHQNLSDKKPHILITSRNQDWDLGGEGEIPQVRLEVFTAEEGKTFVANFLELNDGSQEADIALLTQKLQCLPLALMQAVAYIKKENKRLNKIGNDTFNISCYLKKYQQQASKLLDVHFFKESDRYKKTVLTTWLITLEKIGEHENGREAIEIIHTMAYFSPDKADIGELLFKRGNDDSKWQAIELLNQYSMINLNGGKTDIHRLVQKVIRSNLKMENEEEKKLEEIINFWKSNEITISEVNMSHVTSVWKHASKYKDIILKFYLNLEPVVPTYGRNNGTPLHLLAEYGHEKAIEAILDIPIKKSAKYIDAEDIFNRTPLYIAAENGYERAVALFVNKGGIINKISTKAYNSFSTKLAVAWTPLHVAAFKGYLNIVKNLNEKDNELAKKKDSRGRTPAVLAVINGHIDIVQYLMPGDKIHSFHAKLCAENISNTLNIFEEYLKNCEKNVLEEVVNSKVGEWTPLHLASFANSKEIAKILVMNGATVRGAEKSFTPLHCASAKGHLEMVKFLIEKGANPNDADNQGWIPMFVAAQNGHYGVVQYFINDKEINVNIADKKGTTALHQAAFHGKLDVVKFLLEKKADINAFDKLLGTTPLLLACLNNNHAVVKCLWKEGAQLTVEGSQSFLAKCQITGLHVAAACNYENLVKYLLRMGADKDAGKNASLTPLHFAAFFDRTEVIKYLIKEGAVTDAAANVLNVLDNLEGPYKQLDLNYLHIAKMKQILLRCQEDTSKLVQQIVQPGTCMPNIANLMSKIDQKLNSAIDDYLDQESIPPEEYMFSHKNMTEYCQSPEFKRMLSQDIKPLPITPRFICELLNSSVQELFPPEDTADNYVKVSLKNEWKKVMQSPTIRKYFLNRLQLINDVRSIYV